CEAGSRIHVARTYWQLWPFRLLRTHPVPFRLPGRRWRATQVESLLPVFLSPSDLVAPADNEEFRSCSDHPSTAATLPPYATRASHPGMLSACQYEASHRTASLRRAESSRFQWAH